jgi:hypothetical protein
MTLNQSEMFEEEEQFKQLRLASGRDSKTRSAITLKCFRKLFDIYTEMLKLNAKDTYALKQVYRLCCQWAPIFSSKLKKEELFELYNHVFCVMKFKDPDWFRALRVKAVIYPDYTYKDSRETAAEGAYSIIYSECKKAAAYALEYYQNTENGVEAACLFADNALWKLGKNSEESSKQIYAGEAMQGFNTALQIICGNKEKKIDALVGLWALTGEKEHIDRAISINAAEVYRATFGRLGEKGS